MAYLLKILKLIQIINKMYFYKLSLIKKTQFLLVKDLLIKMHNKLYAIRNISK